MKLDEVVYSTEIEIKYGSLAAMVRWCQTTCTGDWGYWIVDPGGATPGKYNFDFATEADYINFILWQK